MKPKRFIKEVWNPQGSAQEEYDKYLQSSEAALNRFKGSMTETYQSVLNGDTNWYFELW